MVEIRVLRYFLAVVDHGSVTAAARAVRVAQPSLSRQLHNLQQKLGVELFRRGPGALRLSVAGERFLPLARDLVARADQASSVLRHLARGDDIPLTIAAPATTIADVLAPYLAGRYLRSGLNDIIERDTRTVYDVVQRGDADIGISTFPPPGSMETRVIGRAPVCALASPEHPLAGRTQVPLADLARESLILMHRTNAARLAFDTATAGQGLAYVDPRIVSVTSVARALAASGQGVAVLTDQPLFDLVRVPIRIPEGFLAVTLYAGWDPEHFAATAVSALVDSITDYHRNVLTPTAEITIADLLHTPDRP
ncbi:LysR family transcriptional regulator [Rhodococcus opacus]|uniref:LysR family transcriptional regulator n=1 Tax=Rhodococcus opacus TaxID=37919 RepID=UPI0029543D1D|nr:LysR family transcriptional regulator [Rhodococcus opacus]MDV7085954.1 LysR family transcriptional regulator [Rhodococcus opacus]